MRRKIAVLIASVGLAIASPTVFSVHDDLLAFPQYEVVFSDAYISDAEVQLLVDSRSKDLGDNAPAEDSRGIQSQNGRSKVGGQSYGIEVDKKQEYETMWLHDQEYLCSIPVVEIPPRNETSEAEARAEEQKELARATDRGWELLQDLEGNCMYLISGWWSYSFCYNSEVTQFHQAPPQQGKPAFPPTRDMTTPQYILGRSKLKKHTKAKADEWGNEVEVRNDLKSASQTVDLQVKGDTRYLVQKMEGGTVCDLTGKPRRIEIQYHCNPHVTDRIGWIKEVTTCAYLMVIHTPRLCSDVAFLPQKESKPHPIACRQVVRDDELAYWKELRTVEAELSMRGPPVNSHVTVGGMILGAGKYFSRDGPKLQVPPNWVASAPGPATEIIARKLANNKVETATDEQLARLDLDPKEIEHFKDELQRRAGDKPWKLEVVDVPGETREIRGVLDADPEEDDAEGNGNGGKPVGSEEEYEAHEEL